MHKNDDAKLSSQRCGSMRKSGACAMLDNWALTPAAAKGADRRQGQRCNEQAQGAVPLIVG